MSDSKQSSQSRFLMAALLSMLVFYGYSYFFLPKKAATDNANTAQAVVTATPQATAAVTTPVQAQNQTQAADSAPDATPNKFLTIKTPLYEVKLDSKGALAASWILLKNVSTQNPQGKPLFADGSNKENEKPLELISEEAGKRGELPFRLATGDANLDGFINGRNYQISAPEENIEIPAGQTKQIDFVLRDAASGVEATKTFVFTADSYVTDLQIKLTKNGQPVPNTKLLIGSSIGDQGIAKHNYYHIEPEGVAFTGEKGIERHPGGAFTYDANNQGSLAINGAADWAGIGDAYFAMAAIPAQKTNGGLEFHATKYEVPTAPYFDGLISWITRSEKTSETRHLITAYVPISTDGSSTKIFTGTKDYFVLKDYSQALTQAVGREVSIVDFVNFSNYSWFRWLTKPITIPIVYALNFLNSITQNYGVAIILFTLLFYSLLFPLRWSQSKSFKKSAGNAPKMKDLQERLKEMQKQGIPADDPRMRALQVEQLKMTKDALPIGGCLPMLLQFPLLIALYTAVTVSIGFRQATFLWLPDLSASDPYHFLEFGFAASMILSMKFTPQAAAITPEQQMQQKMMTYLMPVMMLWIMWSAPAGLLIYWLFGNVVSFVQQILINRINKPKEPPTTEIVASVPKNAKSVKPKLSTS
jgi:YidC/Oxa1 family membrane protein insertase